ncbi:MAG TPA: rhodanese-like domain-containing protein [Gemmatimonadota bacterium]|nr:rhodanese-like domain-containing protein [Gemmatimonadota bacterium]
MLFERFEDSGLSQFSYAVGCPGAGSIAIVDPRRDIDVYLDFADREGVTITHVFETHIHADFASGARELGERTGAKLCLSKYDAGEKYDVAFAHTELEDGDAIEIGSVRIHALHTPGHTPEHLAFLIFDTHRSTDVPEILLSGDFLFIGSLGRPDLLGEEAKRDLAHRLFASVRDKLAGLPDGLEVHPGHGAGSMCGAGMSARPLSTLGFERVANPYLDPDLSETAFVEKILGSAPPFPPYYRRMKERNSAGPLLLNGLPGLDPLDVTEFSALAREGHVVVDLRDQLAFGGGHVPGALGIGVSGGSLSTWAAWVVPYETSILLVAEHEADVETAVRALVRVGLDDVRGWLDGGMSAWRQEGLPIATLPQMSSPELAAALENGPTVHVLDVRADGEWSGGHIEGALHVHGGLVGDHLGELPRNGRPLAVICGSGYRSTVVASVLKRAGFDDVRNVPGGMRGWRSAELPVVR